MFDRKDGQNYAPEGKSEIVCKDGEFIVAAIRIDHGHIYGMCNGLQEAGATIGFVYDEDKEKVKLFQEKYPKAVSLKTEIEAYSIKEINLIATSAVASERCAIGLKTLESGKDFFSDKPPFTTLEQVKDAKQMVKKTNQKWFVYYSERLHVEAAIYAQKLIEEGRIGSIVAIKGWGPHRLGLFSRPKWFFEKDKYGGILTDIGCHQLEQILSYSGAKDARLVSSQTGNLRHPQYPGLEDFGEALFVTDNNIPCYLSVDWFTPDGLSTWGDGRMIIIGDKGYIELRKYLNVATDKDSDHLFVVDEKGENHYKVHGKVGFPFFGSLIRDSLDRTDKSMDQELVFKAISLAIEAELNAKKISFS